MTKADPPKLGEDPLSEFIKKSTENTFATYVNLKAEYKLLEYIDKHYRVLIENLPDTPERFGGFFFLRTHSSFLGGARLSLSGQIPEAFMVLRGCLENALYGLYLGKNPDSRETWLRRHDDEETYRKNKNEFQIRRLLDFLMEVDKELYRSTNVLYERTIDYGAHPNERAISSNLSRTKEEGSIEFSLRYLTVDSPALHYCLRSNAQVGVCALDIFGHIYRKLYDMLGISDALKMLKKEL
jgi:hypothetical protein